MKSNFILQRFAFCGRCVCVCVCVLAPGSRHAGKSVAPFAANWHERASFARRTFESALQNEVNLGQHGECNTVELELGERERKEWTLQSLNISTKEFQNATSLVMENMRFLSGSILTSSDFLCNRFRIVGPKFVRLQNRFRNQIRNWIRIWNRTRIRNRIRLENRNRLRNRFRNRLYN